MLLLAVPAAVYTRGIITGRLVVFGGRTAERVDVNETWEFDGTLWQQR